MKLVAFLIKPLHCIKTEHLKSSRKPLHYILLALAPSFLIFSLWGLSYDPMLKDKTTAMTIVALVLIFLLYTSIYSVLKTPRISITGSTITYKTLSINESFNISAITEISKVKSNLNRWYSKRVGLEILADNIKVFFPFHIYSNEQELLRAIYQTKESLIPIKSSYSLEHLKYIKYTYRNLFTMYLFLALPFIWLPFHKESPLWSSMIIWVIALLFLLVFFMSTGHIKIQDGMLHYTNPLILRKKNYPLDSIDYVNSKNISIGGNGGIKNLTIGLKDKQIFTLRSGLNRQKEINEIAKMIERTV